MGVCHPEPRGAGRMARLASRAAHGREGRLSRNRLDFVPERFEVLVSCTDARKALRLLLMVRGRVDHSQGEKTQEVVVPGGRGRVSS